MGVSIKIPGRGPGTGPILPTPLHSVGVSGALHRFAAERLKTGAFTEWADAGSAGVPLARSGASAGPVEVRSENGLKFLHMANVVANAGTNTPAAVAELTTATDTSLLLPDRKYTFAMVARKTATTGTDIFGVFAGTRLSRPGNGAARVETIGTGASGAQATGGNFSLNAWHLVMGVSGNAGTVRVDAAETASSTTWTPGTTAGPLQLTAAIAAASIDLDVAEIIIWPRALSTSERGDVQAALKARYNVLP